MKAIKITKGNITKRINSGAKNFEDLIDLTKKIFELGERDLFYLTYIDNLEEKILENDEEYQNLLSKIEDNKPLKLKLEENEVNIILKNSNPYFDEQLKKNLNGNAMEKSIYPIFYGDVYCKEELLSDFKKILQENLKEMTKTITSVIEKKNEIFSPEYNIYSNETCNNCKINITIIKYECLICNNLILCENCKNIHGIHPLIMFNLSSNELKNKKDIDFFYKKKFEKEKNKDIPFQILEEKKIIENEKQKEKTLFKFSISTQNLHKKYKDNESCYNEIFTIKNETNFDFENDDLNFFIIDQNIDDFIMCQNEKIDKIKANEKKNVSIDFYISNTNLQQLNIKFILKNENSKENQIESNELDYCLPINQKPKNIPQIQNMIQNNNQVAVEKINEYYKNDIQNMKQNNNQIPEQKINEYYKNDIQNINDPNYNNNMNQQYPVIIHQPPPIFFPINALPKKKFINWNWKHLKKK